MPSSLLTAAWELPSFDANSHVHQKSDVQAQNHHRHHHGKQAPSYPFNNMTSEDDQETSTTPDLTLEKKRIEAYFSELYLLLVNEDWNRLLNRIQVAPTVLTDTRSLRRLGAVLEAASTYSRVPLELFTTVIKIAGKDALLYTDTGLRTPFHVQLIHLDRPDITRTLLEACRSDHNNNNNNNNNNDNLVHLRDVEGLRGIDILTQKMLMKEEHLRYLKDRATMADVESFKDCVECARLVTIHHGNLLPHVVVHDPNDDGIQQQQQQQQAIATRDYNLPMLHACCLARSDVPLSLLERTIRRVGNEQACLADARGNTPLHYVAAYLPTDEMDDFLPRVLRIDIQAASMKNLRDEYPIDLAIRYGRKWSTGCRLLIEAHPPAILAHQVTTIEAAKTILFELTQKSCYASVFALIRTRPEILF